MNNQFLHLGNIYLTSYLNGTFHETMIAKFQAVRGVLVEVYGILVSTGRLQRIETLTPEQKSGLWETCKEYVKELKTADRIKFVKAYWALCGLAQERNK